MGQAFVDADGHIMERENEINEHIEQKYLGRGSLSFRQMLPSLDKFHTPRSRHIEPEGIFDASVGPERWLEFLAKTGIESSVLYPTAGLSYGQVHFPEWAAAYARAYNDWFAEKYIKVSDRFKGVALIPVQDVKAAVKELRRAVKDLGMVCAMLPSNGLDRHYGSDEFNPLYEEAEKLDCALAVHGGCYGDLGFNSFKVFPATRALGMPFPLAIHMTGMMSEGVFDRFPDLRVGFLEGGTAWIPLVLDRLNREVEYGGLQLKKDPIEYFRSGKVFVGCEGNEDVLVYCVNRIGHEVFMFCSDFPHEITMDNCMEEIDEIRDREELTDEQKQAILGDNARNFYKI